MVDAEDDRRVTIVLDTQLPRDLDRENFRIRFESGVTQAASLVKHFIEEGAEVCLSLGDQRKGFGAGQEHLYACLRRLALVKPNYKAGDYTWSDELATRADPRALSPESNYLILLTAATQGSIPPHIWRRAFVIYL